MTKIADDVRPSCLLPEPPSTAPDAPASLPATDTSPRPTAPPSTATGPDATDSFRTIGRDTLSAETMESILSSGPSAPSPRAEAPSSRPDAPTFRASEVRANPSILGSSPSHFAPVTTDSSDTTSAPAPGSTGEGTQAHGSHGVRGAGGPVTAATGEVNDAAWRRDPASVLGRLPQRVGPTSTVGAAANESNRCGAANVLGAAIMNGPDATARTLDNTAASSDSALTAEERQRMRDIAGHVRSGNTTFDELSEAQGLLYRAGNTHESLRPQDVSTLEQAARRLNREGHSPAASDLADAAQMLRSPNGHLANSQIPRVNAALASAGERLRLVNDESGTMRVGTAGDTGDRSGMSDREIAALARRGGSATMSRPFESGESFDTLLGNPPRGLQAGQSATIRVDPDPTDNRPYAEHFVTVGRDTSGRAYLYNSDPGVRGDATLVSGRDGGAAGDAEVLRAARRYNSRLHRNPDTGAPEQVVIVNHRR